MFFKGIASQQFILNDTHLGKSQLLNRNHYQESHRNRITDLSHKKYLKSPISFVECLYRDEAVFEARVK